MSVHVDRKGFFLSVLSSGWSVSNYAPHTFTAFSQISLYEEVWRQNTRSFTLVFFFFFLGYWTWIFGQFYDVKEIGRVILTWNWTPSVITPKKVSLISSAYRPGVFCKSSHLTLCRLFEHLWFRDSFEGCHKRLGGSRWKTEQRHLFPAILPPSLATSRLWAVQSEWERDRGIWRWKKGDAIPAKWGKIHAE